MPDQILKRTKIKKSNIAKFYIFYNDFGTKDQVFKFSNSINEIGLNNNCSMKNGSKILLLSDSKDANHPIIGPLKVNLVLSLNPIDKQIMWIPSVSIKEI